MGNVLLFFLLSLILEVVFCESEVLSVKAGDSVTFHTDSQIQTGDVIYWWFGLENKLIARINKAAKTSKIFEDELDGKFKGRLKLGQTNDLIITNVMTTDSGHFEVSNEDGVKKSFNVIVVSVDFTKTVCVLEGDLVTLHTDDPDIKIYDAIEWRFEHQKSPVAEIKAGNVPKYDETDKRLQGTLQLDPQTGSLNIKNIRIEQAGLYEVDIISSGHTVHKSYNVFVSGVSMSVLMKNTGESVTLHTDANLQDYDFTLWSYEGTDLAEIFKAENRFSTYDGPDGKFRGRLKLDEQTGDLTITDVITTDTGKYELKMTSSRHTIHKKFTVAVNSSGWSSGAIATAVLFIILLAVAIGVAVWYHRHRISKLKKQMYAAKTESVTEGDPVTLHTGCVLQGDSVIMWQFEGKFIAKISGQDNINTELDFLAKFTGRLRVDTSSGSLTISETTATDSGCYKVRIDTGGKHFSYKFIVTVVPKKDEDTNNPLMRNSGNNV